MEKKLSEEEISYLIKEWKESKNKKAYEKIINNSISQVAEYAKKYLGQGLSYEELVSAGNLGLISAINSYNPEKVSNYTSYIKNAIENSIKEEINKNNQFQTVSLSEPIGTNADGDIMTVSDTIIFEDEELLEMIIGKIKSEIVTEVLEQLSPKEKLIILLRYGVREEDKKSIEEIASVLGLEVSDVTNHENKALVKMRKSNKARKLNRYIED